MKNIRVEIFKLRETEKEETTEERRGKVNGEGKKKRSKEEGSSARGKNFKQLVRGIKELIRIVVRYHNSKRYNF